MTILTALLVLVGIGAVLNRGEDGQSVFSSSGSYRPKPDSFTLRAGRVQSLDVLLNDSNADRIDASSMRIVSVPHCGTAEALNGAVQYSDSDDCTGAVAFTYCIPEGENCAETTVALNIVREEDAIGNNRPDGSPQVVSEIDQSSAPADDQQQVAMKQPMRLTLPETAEVITPQQAAEEVRRLGGMGSQTVVAADDADSAVVVSNTSARSGRVDTSGFSMQAPEIGTDSAEIALAQPSTPASPGRPSVPNALSMTSVDSPRFEAAPSIDLSIPAPGDGPGNGSQAETEVAIALPAPADSPRPAAPPQPADGRPVIPVPADGAAVKEPRPVEPTVAIPETAAPDVTPVIEPDPAPEETQIAALPPEPVSVEPEAAPVEELPAGPGPLAQSDQPAAPESRAEIPETSGILASVARGNAVIGVTFSAAKALLSPSDVRNAIVVAPGGNAAPRPRDFAIVAALETGDTRFDASAGLVPLSADRPISQRFAAEIQLASLSADTRFVPRTLPAAPPPELDVADDTPAAETPEQGTEVAALPPLDGVITPGPVLPAPRPSVDCDVDMVLKVRVGAELQATLSSPCRPDTPFTVDHAGLRFTGTTDLDGVADFIIPAMASNATVSVSFGDGAFTVAQAEVENMSRMTRVAIVWDGDVDFDIHAFEYGAEPESIGHIRPGYRRDYRSARRAGGGYLTQLGPSVGIGARAEVYTIFESSRTKEGLIDLEVRLASVGDGCTGSPALRVLRSDGPDAGTIAPINLEFDVCGQDARLVVEDLAGDIDMAAR